MITERVSGGDVSTVITQCRTVRTVLEAMLQGPCGPREWHRTPSSVRPLFMLVPPNLGACLPGTVPRTIFFDQVGCSLVLALSGMNHMKHCWAVISQLFTCCPTPATLPLQPQEGFRSWVPNLGYIGLHFVEHYLLECGKLFFVGDILLVYFLQEKQRNKFKVLKLPSKSVYISLLSRPLRN